MYELFILVVLITIVVLSMRRGKAVMERPLIFERAGQYHITLAPQLEGAQMFIEKIANQLTQSPPSQGEFPSLFFEVRDSNMLAENTERYLLAFAYRGGTLYAQAINPQPLLRDDDSHLKQVQAFSDAVMALHPLKHPSNDAEIEILCRVVEKTAPQLNITVTRLIDPDIFENHRA